MKIPFKKLITVKHPLVKEFCSSLNLTEFSSAEKLRENQVSCLVLFILVQLHQPDPTIKYYFETIPKNFHEYPQYFMEAELPKLNNSFMANKYNFEISNINKIFALAQKANLNKMQNKDFTQENVKHAYIALYSRNFELILESEKKEYRALAPYTDMFNDNPIDIHTNWTSKITDENGFFNLKANKDIAKGKEIFVFYGYYDNERLLFEFGFTLENNPFPADNEFFLYMHKGKEYYGTLRMGVTTNLVDIVKGYRNKNNIKYNIKKDKENIKKTDLKVFRIVLESLKNYSDKGRLEEYKNNMNHNPNYLNIYRALLTEDMLIDNNVKYLEEIIEVLDGGREKLKEKVKSKVVDQNKEYFENLLL